MRPLHAPLADRICRLLVEEAGVEAAMLITRGGSLLAHAGRSDVLAGYAQLFVPAGGTALEQGLLRTGMCTLAAPDGRQALVRLLGDDAVLTAYFGATLSAREVRDLVDTLAHALDIDAAPV